MSRPLLLLAAVAGLACSDSTEPTTEIGPPSRIERIVNPTTATAGDVLEPAVRVTDRRGNPVEGVFIKWIGANGSSAVAKSGGLTNAEGIAVAEWWLGNDAKTYSMSAHAIVGTGAETATVAVTTFQVVATPRPGTA